MAGEIYFILDMQIKEQGRINPYLYNVSKLVIYVIILEAKMSDYKDSRGRGTKRKVPYQFSFNIIPEMKKVLS